jgi:hypothetical protein
MMEIQETEEEQLALAFLEKRRQLKTSPVQVLDNDDLPDDDSFLRSAILQFLEVAFADEDAHDDLLISINYLTSTLIDSAFDVQVAIFPEEFRDGLLMPLLSSIPSLQFAVISLMVELSSHAPDLLDVISDGQIVDSVFKLGESTDRDLADISVRFLMTVFSLQSTLLALHPIQFSVICDLYIGEPFRFPEFPTFVSDIVRFDRNSEFVCHSQIFVILTMSLEQQLILPSLTISTFLLQNSFEDFSGFVVERSLFFLDLLEISHAPIRISVLRYLKIIVNTNIPLSDGDLQYLCEKLSTLWTSPFGEISRLAWELTDLLTSCASHFLDLQCLSIGLAVYNSDACFDVKVALGRTLLHLASLCEDSVPADLIDEMTDMQAELDDLSLK